MTEKKKRVGQPLELGSIARAFFKELNEIGEAGMIEKMKNTKPPTTKNDKEKS